MKKLLHILLYLPIIGFGQDYKKVKSEFDFNKSNNYNSGYSKAISNNYYNSTSKFNFSNPVKKNNDSTSSYIFYSKSEISHSPFSKGMIHLISKAMQKGVHENPSIIKKDNHNQTTID